MSAPVKRLPLLLLSCVATQPTAHAHHSFAAFDMKAEITLHGVVQSYVLQNPHAHLVIKVAARGASDQDAGLWDVEGAAANIMRRQGWSSQSFKAGDAITVVGHPLHTGDRGLSLFYAIRADGTRMYQDIARPVATAK
jgi:hypothetical protein